MANDGPNVPQSKFSNQAQARVVLPQKPNYCPAKRAGEKDMAPYFIPVFRQTEPDTLGFERDPGVTYNGPADFLHLFVDQKFTGGSAGMLEWTEGRCLRVIIVDVAEEPKSALAPAAPSSFAL